MIRAERAGFALCKATIFMGSVVIGGCYTDTHINPREAKAKVMLPHGGCPGDFVFTTTKEGKVHQWKACTVTDSYIESCNLADFTFEPKKLDRVPLKDVSDMTVRHAANCLLK